MTKQEIQAYAERVAKLYASEKEGQPTIRQINTYARTVIVYHTAFCAPSSRVIGKDKELFIKHFAKTFIAARS